jgi:hypothetical protein
MWLQLDQRTETGHSATLARADPPHQWHGIGRFDFGLGVDSIWIGPTAADGSAVTIRGDTGDQSVISTTLVVRADDAKATPHDGNVIGFVSADVVERWP